MSTLDELVILLKMSWEGGPASTKATSAMNKIAEAAKAAGINIDTGMLAKMATGVAVVGAFTAALKLANTALQEIREHGREGAALDQLRLSFETLTTSVLHVPEVLADLKAGFNGVVSDTQAMSAYLTLTAGVSDELSVAFAENAGALAEIAKAAAVLNPTLGDVNYMWESLATGIKRASFRLLDNLGLVIRQGELYKQFAEAHDKSVLALTAEEKQLAILYGVLDVGQNLIRQAGGNADSLTDSYDRLTASWTNFTDNLKISFSRVVEATGLIGELSNKVTELALRSELVNLAERLKEMGVEAAGPPGPDSWLWFMSPQGLKELGTEEALAALEQSIADSNLQLRVMQGDLTLTGAELLRVSEIIKQQGGLLGDTTWEYKDFAGATQYFSRELSELEKAFIGVNERQMDYRMMSAETRERNTLLAEMMQDAKFGAFGLAEGLTMATIALGGFHVPPEAEKFLAGMRDKFENWDETTNYEKRKFMVEQFAAELGILPEEFLRILRAQEKVNAATEWWESIIESLPGAVRNSLEVWKQAQQELRQSKYEFDQARLEEEKNALDEFNSQLQQKLAERGALIQQYLTPGDDEGGLFTVDIAFLGLQNVSQITGEQWTELERLRGMYQRIEGQIKDYEMGLTGVGLSEERRAEKIAELNLQLGNIVTAMAPLEEALNTYSTVTNTAVWDTEEIQEALYNLALAAGPTDKALMGLALNTEFLSEEQAMAALKSAAMAAKIQEVAALLAAGKIDWDQANEILGEFGEKMDRDYTLKLEEIGVQDALEKAQALQDIMNELDNKRTHSEHTHDVKIVVTKSGPKIEEWEDPDSKVDDFLWDTNNRATGGWIRGPHVPLDMVPAMLTGGERVLSRDEVARMGGPYAVDTAATGGQAGGANITINVTSPMYATPRAIANEVSRRLVVGG